MASGKAHTWLPRPTQGTPCYDNLASLLNKTAWQPCSVRVVVEAVADAVEIFATSFAGSFWPEPVSKMFSARPPQAPGTAPVDINSIIVLLWMPLLGLGPGVAPPETSQSTCRPFQLATEPTDLHDFNCDEQDLHPCPDSWVREPPNMPAADCSGAVGKQRMTGSACMAHTQPCLH
eukprot:1161661-Pelagomonas_calceolata.AAC.10